MKNSHPGFKLSEGEIFMNKEQLLYSQMLMAVAHCEQSDGYLKIWAKEKIARAAGKPVDAVKIGRLLQKSDNK
jgi:hypothetical protein